MSPLTLIFWCFVTWRLTALLVHDAITNRLRDLIGVRYDEQSQSYGTNVLASILACFWCASIWIAGVVTLIWLSPVSIAMGAAYVLALSGGSILIDKMVNA